MAAILDKIQGLPFVRVEGDCLRVDQPQLSQVYLAVDPEVCSVEVAPLCRATIVVVYSQSKSSTINYSVADGATLDIVELYLTDVESNSKVQVQRDANVNIIAIQGCSSRAKIVVEMLAQGAYTQADMLQIVDSEESSSMQLDVRHMSSDCRSRSQSKCLAAGSAKASFAGMVYVAKDAQRTDAQQSSRNIELSDNARITSRPELEIYADDVKCSHGATVGQIDGEAILYMRQRGICEEQARRLLLEGFVADILDNCNVEELQSMLSEYVLELLHNLK